MACWSELTIKVSTYDLEKATAIVSIVAPDGIQIEDYSDIDATLKNITHYDYISDELLGKDKSFANIKIYCEPEANIFETKSFIEERFKSENIQFELNISSIEETDWQESWKQYYHPQKIGNRLVICPSWESYTPNEKETVVILDPGMSFGTGEHESTQLCLSLLESFELLSKSLLDIGAGSGILGIAALKLGASSVTAVDIDAISVSVSKENARINGVSNSFDVIHGNISEEKILTQIPVLFDYITANIVADFHISNRTIYFDKLKKGGRLIASGIIMPQFDEVKSALEDIGFNILEERLINSWGAILAQKP